MKVLFVVPHYYRGMGDNTRYASHSNRKKAQRIQALDQLIFQIHSLYGNRHIKTINHDHEKAALRWAQSTTQNDFDIVVCTTGHDHLLYEISCPGNFYHHLKLQSEPIWLGFAAQRFMLDQKGRYDYYCYLEDDIILHDSGFFIKLRFFNDTAPAHHLLLPQRYETPWIIDGLKKQCYTKVYSDYAEYIKPERALHYSFDFLGCPIDLVQPGLVHAGCYFLSAEQFEYVSGKPEFANYQDVPVDRALDAAASLAIASHFLVFKPSGSNLDFFEVEHGVGNMFDQIALQPDGVISWSWSQDQFDFSASTPQELKQLV